MIEIPTITTAYTLSVRTLVSTHMFNCGSIVPLVLKHKSWIQFPSRDIGKRLSLLLEVWIKPNTIATQIVTPPHSSWARFNTSHRLQYPTLCWYIGTHAFHIGIFVALSRNTWSWVRLPDKRDKKTNFSAFCRFFSCQMQENGKSWPKNTKT